MASNPAAATVASHDQTPRTTNSTEAGSLSHCQMMGATSASSTPKLIASRPWRTRSDTGSGREESSTIQSTKVIVASARRSPARISAVQPNGTTQASIRKITA